MNAQALAATSEQSATGLVQLSGPALHLARLCWWVGAIIAVLGFIVALPVNYSLMQQVCAAPNCALTPTSAHDLEAVGLSAHFLADFLVAIELVFSLIWVIVGLFIFQRRSADPMALFVSFFIVVFGANAYSSAADAPVDSPFLHTLFTAVSFAANLLSFLFFYLFPDGRFVPRWTRFFAIAVLIITFLISFLRDLPLVQPLNAQRESLLILILVSCAFAQIYRYWRVSDVAQRQQSKIVVFGLIAAVAGRIGVGLLLGVLPANAFVLVALSTLLAFSLLLIPITIAVAVLRYRLWDVDILINRALLYSVLTLCVLAVYVLVVGSLGALFQASNNLLIALLATGLVAVLVQPLRERLQRAVNHLVYGERDDPYVVLSRLGQRLEAAAAPGATLNTIVETVAQALKLPYAAIVLGQQEDGRPAAAYGNPLGQLTRLPLQDQGEPVGELLLSPRASGETLTPGDLRLLGDLARQIGATVHAVMLTADLQRSRERLVLAREEERRRIRRDLHDGLGPTLAALALNASTIGALIPDNPQAAAAMTADLQREIRGTVADIRRLVYDLRPPTLDELGLLAAIREAALHYSAQFTTANSAGALTRPIITVEAPDKLPALPAAVEVAAYRIVQEGLTNVVKHARAAHCIVRLTLPIEAVQIEIVDDGVGLPEERGVGLGLVSMRERAEELGGTYTIESIEGGGTRICAVLPLPKEQQHGAITGIDR